MSKMLSSNPYVLIVVLTILAAPAAVMSGILAPLLISMAVTALKGLVGR
jgi:hypothetical protein